MYSERPANDFYQREGKELFLNDLYDYNGLIDDLENRGMEKAMEIVEQCFKAGKSLKDVFEELGQDEETRNGLQEIRTLFKKHKIKENAEDKNK